MTPLRRNAGFYMFECDVMERLFRLCNEKSSKPGTSCTRHFICLSGIRVASNLNANDTRYDKFKTRTICQSYGAGLTVSVFL